MTPTAVATTAIPVGKAATLIAGDRRFESKPLRSQRETLRPVAETAPERGRAAIQPGDVCGLDGGAAILVRTSATVVGTKATELEASTILVAKSAIPGGELANDGRALSIRGRSCS
jgi:hypothetical protein